MRREASNATRGKLGDYLSHTPSGRHKLSVSFPLFLSLLDELFIAHSFLAVPFCDTKRFPFALMAPRKDLDHEVPGRKLPK